MASSLSGFSCKQETNYTLPQNATFQSGKVYTYNIKVNLTDLEVTSSITDWTTDGDYSGDSNGEANM